MSSAHSGSGRRGIPGCAWPGIVSIAFLTACVVSGGAWRTDIPVQLPEKAEGATLPFEESLTARHWFWGLYQGQQANVRLALGKFLREGEEVSEMTITTRLTASDCLLTIATLGIYSPVTVTVRGRILTARPGA